MIYKCYCGLLFSLLSRKIFNFLFHKLLNFPGGGRKMKSAFLLLLILVPAAYADILIQEVFPNPPGNERGHEYLLLINPLGWEVNLSLYRLVDLQNNSMVLHGTLLPNSSIQIFPSFSLNNDHEAILLFHSTSLVDNFSYRSAKENVTLLREIFPLRELSENVINVPESIMYESKNKKSVGLTPYLFAILLVFLLWEYFKT